MTSNTTPPRSTEFVALPRTAIRGSSRTGDRSVPLIRTESSETTDDQLIEVPIPLSKVEDESEAHILHVDDNAQIGNLVQTYLERINDDFTVTTETSAVAALNRLEGEAVDCIISDYQMPNMDGLELLEVVNERYPDTPFILFTGQGNEEIASEAIAAGVTDYMQKGTGTDQYEVLANRVENAVEQHQTEQQFWNALSWYRRLVEQEFAGVCIVQNGTFVYVNRKLADIFGYSQEELIDESVATITAEADDDLVELLRERPDDDADETTFTGRTREGESITVGLSGGSIRYDGDRAWLGVLRHGEDGD